MDKRWYEVAEILVKRSGNVKAGEKVMIAMSETHTEDFVSAVIEKVIQCGAYPQVQFLSERIRHKLLSFGNQEQLKWVPEMESWGMDWADVYFGIRGGFNLGECFDVPPEKLSTNQTVNGIISTQRWEKTRWCLIRIPHITMASQAGISEEELMDNFFDACLLDWQQKAKEWRILRDQLEKGASFRILSSGTDLRFSTEGRKWVVFDGRLNLPDGEIATSPVTSSLDGHVQFQNPGVLGGQLFPDIRLEWKNGVLESARSTKNQELLTKIVHSDEGASLIGEFAFGLNGGLKHFCNDILFDEKISGTVHFALGRAYPECGGDNKSAIHWDIVLDMRKEGEIFLDDKRIFEKGKFLF